MNVLNRVLVMILAVAGITLSMSASAGTIQQTVEFPGVTPDAVYEAYMTSKGHAAMTGMPATYYRPSTRQEVAVGQEGDELRAFGMTGADGKFGYLLGGTILKLVPGREIVMTWRPRAWDESAKPGDDTDLACILVITLKAVNGGVELQMLQTDIPDYPGVGAKDSVHGPLVSETVTVNTHWYSHYWAPMQKYFQVQAGAAKSAP